jgi:hypothetical protein
MLTPLNAALICQIKYKVLQVLLYSRTRLATASPYAIGILYVLAIARGYSCLIVRKDLSKSNIKVKETFVNKLIKANKYYNCSNVKSVLEVLGDFSRISLRFFYYTSGCDYIEFRACFLFIRGPNSRILEGY